MKLTSNHKGVTLIELLIALVITTILVGGIYRLFMAQTRAYTTQENVSDTQQTLRNAVEILFRDIRMAGSDYPFPIQVGGVGPAVNLDPAPALQNVQDHEITVSYEYNGAIYTVRYYVDGNQRLMRNQIQPVEVAPAEAGGDPILENVTDFTLRYLIDTDSVKGSNWEVNAAGSAAGTILAVRVQLSARPVSTSPDLNNLSPRGLDTVVALRSRIN